MESSRTSHRSAVRQSTRLRDTHEPLSFVAGCFVSKTLYSPGRPGTPHWHTACPSHMNKHRDSSTCPCCTSSLANSTSKNPPPTKHRNPDHRPLPLAPFTHSHRHLPGDTPQKGKSSRHEARSAPPPGLKQNDQEAVLRPRSGTWRSEQRVLDLLGSGGKTCRGASFW